LYHEGVTRAEILSNYEDKRDAAQNGIKAGWGRRIGAGAVLIVACVLFFVLLVLPEKKGWAMAAAAGVALAAWTYRRESRRWYRAYRLRLLYQAGIERVNDEWRSHESTGSEFAQPDHVYAGDLNVFGEDSLFQYVCTARTGVGRRGLASLFLTMPSVEEIRTRQEAVRELIPRTDLRERIALLGKSATLESRREVFDAWLELPALIHSPVVRLALLATSLALPVMALACAFGFWPWVAAARWIVGILVFHAAAGLALRAQVNRMKADLRVLSNETQVLRRGFKLLRNERFQSAALTRLAATSPDASASLRRLEWLLGALVETDKEWFYALAIFLMASTQICMAVEAWRERHRESLRIWLNAWAEFEALNCLACYGYENPDHVFPEIVEGDAVFEACAVGHPLLPAADCVRNDVELNGRNRFYIVSGSNMSGKSTLLRAIGLNAVLAFAGAPVRAESLRLSRLAVCASISVVDSLLAGKSKFLAEVDRLRQTIQASETQPALFLIDEIFSGTNSRDRRTASESVVRTLVKHGAIDAVSTHDLALTEIAEEPALNGVNVHMGSRDGSDPMDFDYRLKPGVTREQNALAIARMAGVPV
jgi:hypothetical protein